MMGSQAHSSARLSYSAIRVQLYNPDHKKAFKWAYREVFQSCGTVDGYLHVGFLGCNESVVYLERLARASVYQDKWSAKKVRLLFEAVQWSNAWPEEVDEYWAYYSAYMFLKICAYHKLAIRFKH